MLKLFKINEITNYNGASYLIGIYYFGDVEYTYSEFLKNRHVPAHITFSWSFDELHHLRKKTYYTNINNVLINNLYVQKKYRGMNLASKLLLNVLDDLFKKGINKIELDDMSTNYRKEHNIYHKHGFEYINDHGPEMFITLDKYKSIKEMRRIIN